MSCSKSPISCPTSCQRLGVNTDVLARDRALLRDTIAAMTKPTGIYRDKDK